MFLARLVVSAVPLFLAAGFLAAGFLATGFLAADAFGQTFPAGSIIGRTVLQDGSPLSDVEVRLTDFASGKTITSRSGAAGEFSFTGLRSGRYSLSFHGQGYAVRRMGPYEVLLGSPLRLDVQLDPLSAALTRARAGLEGIALEYGLVREQIESMPILLGSEGRTSIDKLLLMVPGLSPVRALEIDPFSGRAAAVSANGSRRSAINYQLDGASNNSQNRLTGAQAATFGPAPDALETFRVITHTYSARDGRNAGAVVAPLTRSGGATWHGQLRGFWRPRRGEPIERFDGSADSIESWAAGGRLGGPLSRKRGLFVFLDAEGWRSRRRHSNVAQVLTLAERMGDFSASPPGSLPIDPDTRQPYPNGIIPPGEHDPLIRKYLDTFVPAPNLGENLHRSEASLNSRGEMFLGRVDYRWRGWSMGWSHNIFDSKVLDPLSDVLFPAPGVAEERRQISHNSQWTLTQSATPRLSHTTRLAAQRLSIRLWQGHPEYRHTTAEEFGFDFLRFGANPATLPDLRVVDDQGTEKLRVAPFLFAESATQTTFQISHDASYRRSGHALRGGVSYQRGIWPFSNTENPAGSFVFSVPSAGGARNSVANLLIGAPSSYRLQTQRSLNLRWNEWALYGETELRLFRGSRLTLGLRYEAQPPAVDRLDRLAAFRENVDTQRFPDTLPNLIFPGDPDGDLGPLPRSTLTTNGRNLAPRAGFTFSPRSDRPVWRWLLGESGRSVFRASYGVFYDFGALAGSSAAALFQATYPPFSTDRRFDFDGIPGSFRAPFSTIPPPTTDSIRNSVIDYPILVFDRDFKNAQAHHWTLGWQRLLPARVFLSVIYVGTRSLRLQRQRELNVFERNPILPFSLIEKMRRFSQYSDVRQIESSGGSRYSAFQFRATRYLSRGLAFDLSYTRSRARDNSSTIFGDELATEPWGRSNFDRRDTITATWFCQVRAGPGLRDRAPWLDRWQLSGTWRLRSGLPLDIRQTQDPTFSFVRVGRPDVTGEFRRLDPAVRRTFTLPSGQTLSGRFAFDPAVFQRVAPANFDELREGSAPRNGFSSGGFQQWDLRLARPFAISEEISSTLGLDFLNVLGNRNWDLPFRNIDHPYFGIVAAEGLRRTIQINARFDF